jgi:phospholipid transport system transporter-binding protein
MSAPQALTGELTLKRMPALLQQAGTLATAGTLDLSAITRADSAGVAFLLELTRRAQQRGSSLRFAAAPPQLRQLTDFFGLTSALHLHA